MLLIQEMEDGDGKGIVKIEGEEEESQGRASHDNDLYKYKWQICNDNQKRKPEIRYVCAWEHRNDRKEMNQRAKVDDGNVPSGEMVTGLLWSLPWSERYEPVAPRWSITPPREDGVWSPLLNIIVLGFRRALSVARE